MCDPFPEILVYALRALSTEAGRKAAWALLKARTPLTVTEVAEAARVTAEEAEEGLRALETGAIAEKTVENGVLKYRLTDFGAGLLTSLLATVTRPTHTRA